MSGGMMSDSPLKDNPLAKGILDDIEYKVTFTPQFYCVYR